MIFGGQHPTPDGSCVRDFIHVQDLAYAHVAAIDALDSAGAAHVFNVGCGRGYSVRGMAALCGPEPFEEVRLD